MPLIRSGILMPLAKRLLIVTSILFAFGVLVKPHHINSVSLQQIDRPQLVLQTGHALGVNCIAYSPDVSWLASAGADNSIIIWQTSSGRQLRKLTGHSGYVRSIAVSANGKWLASGSNDRAVKLWDVDNGREIFSLQGHTGPIVSLAFSPNGHWLSSGSLDNTIKVWDLNIGSEAQTLNRHTAPVSALAFNSSGNLLLSAAGSDLIAWDTKTWQERKTFKHGNAAITALAFGNDEYTLACATADGSIVLLRIDFDRERVLKQNRTPVLRINFANKSLIAIHANGGIENWDYDKRTLNKSIPGDNNREQLVFAAFGPADSYASTNGSRVLTTNSLTSGEVINRFESHSTPINAIAFSADGRWFASGANDSSIRLWQIATGRELPRLMGHAGYVTTIAFSPDSNFLASGSRSDEVRIWDLNSSHLAFTLPSKIRGVNNIAFSSNGKLLAVVGIDPKVEVWDLEKKTARTMTGHTQEITSVVFAKELLVTAGRDKTIRFWNADTGALVKSLETASEVNGIAASPDGKLLATANADKTIRCLNIEGGDIKQTLGGHAGEVLAVRFGPDGNSIVSASADHTAIVWDLESGKSIHQLKGSIDTVTTAAYSMNGEWIFTGSDDGTIQVWQTGSGELKATLVSLSGSDDWLVATPDGLFDGTPESWDLMLWRFEQSTFKVVPVEAYFNEYYYPGVLAEILAGQNPQPPEDIVQKDRRQPSVNVKAETEPNSRNVNIDLVISSAGPDKNHPNYSGARDLRLFRNGLLVKAWTGDVLKSDKTRTIQATVPIVAGQNRFTAYAFNTDNIKSADANLIVNGAESLQRQGTAYLLMVGVEQYENTEFNLRYSVADVSELEEQLTSQQEKLGKYNPIVTIPLVNTEATKANILLALDRLSGNSSGPLPKNAPEVLSKIKPAQPEDAVFIYFSGHGVSADNHFYLIPYDLGYHGPRKKLDASGLQTVLSHGISDREIEAALQPLDVNQLLLVIDACYSGQAVESSERRRGPMNTKGLAQLAYEKGIYVLTASQNIEVAFEAEALKHSYLAYALVEEGLKEGAADEDRDGNIFLREWFEYANNRVPQLRKLRLKKELVEDEADEQRVQRPRVFYTREEGAKTFLIGRVPTK